MADDTKAELTWEDVLNMSALLRENRVSTKYIVRVHPEWIKDNPTVAYLKRYRRRGERMKKGK